MTRIVILLVALIWGSAQAIALADGPIRWIDRQDFTGTVFRFDGERCRAGVFGADLALTGTGCTGDPWSAK